MRYPPVVLVTTLDDKVNVVRRQRTPCEGTEDVQVRDQAQRPFIAPSVKVAQDVLDKLDGSLSLHPNQCDTQSLTSSRKAGRHPTGAFTKRPGGSLFRRCRGLLQQVVPVD
jgi:hypothetical protein